MTWQSVRLELDSTPDFPRGSASRAYLLRLPLLDDGSIDEDAIAEAPERATMRRMWPNEPDCSGHVRRLGDCWACVVRGDGADNRIVASFSCRTLREGCRITLDESGSNELPFRVAKLRPLARPS
jgi:hypothetical protein